MFSSNTSQVAAGGGVNYIEDVFSTQVYPGTGATNNIVNGVDLATYGGLVWTKARTTTSAFSFAHALIDTLRGVGVQLSSDQTAANYTQTNSLTAFNANGYTLGTDSGGQGRVNNTSYGTQTYVSWTFRKAPKFFDIVTWTGDGAGTRYINHDLTSVPGCIIVKAVGTTSNWFTWHIASGITAAKTAFQLNSTDGNQVVLNSTTYVTSTSFDVGAIFDTAFNSPNQNGRTYVAYVFAHNAGGFGLTGTDNVISCGSYTGNGSTTGPVITLGYEPQWLMVKNTTTAGWSWYIVDNMRGFSETQYNWLAADQSTAETVLTERIKPLATGFQPVSTAPPYNGSGDTYIYIAIRRGPMKVPTSGTSVFTPISNTSPATGCLTDMVIARQPTGTQNTWNISRLTNAFLQTNTTAAETANASYLNFDTMSGVVNAGFLSNSNSIWWNMRRAPSFFDEVCITTSGYEVTATHNLGVRPELIIGKARNQTGSWVVWVSSVAALNVNNTLILNTTAAATNNGMPINTVTATSFYAAIAGVPVETEVFYLFATCAGVSKVFSFTGSGSLQTINCGFTSGARFVLVKRTDSTGDWYVWDSARGISSSTDPYLLLNSTAAEVTSTNWVDTTSTGFQVTAASGNNVNINGATYIGLAIA